MYYSKQIVVSGLRQVLEIAPELDALRMRLGLENELSTEIHQVLSLNDRKSRRPVCVLFENEEAILEGAVILFERRICGIGTGVLRAGDHAGDGAVIAEPNDRSTLLLLAVELLLRDWRFHTIFGTVSRSDQEIPLRLRNPQVSNSVTSREVRRRLLLAGTYEDTVASFGRKIRKGVRQKRKRFEKRTDVEFHGNLSAQQALEAMMELAATSYPRRSRWEIEQRYEFLVKHPDGYSMGLRLNDGQWMSFITGWRTDGVTYVPWAMHNQRFRSDSLGTVMYTYLIEHEAKLQQKCVEWVGGVTELWSKVCAPEQCFCVTRSRPGLRSTAIRYLTPLFQKNSALEYYRNELSAEHDDGLDDDPPIGSKTKQGLASQA